jgi:hypothetical protein
MDEKFPAFYFDPNALSPELKVELYNMRYDSGKIAREQKRAARKQQNR